MTVQGFLLGTLSGILASWLDHLTSFLVRNGLPLPKYLYYREIRDQLSRMPFIYQDLEVTVIQDSVTVELEPIHSATLTAKTSPTFIGTSTFQRLREHRKIILIGQAGIGKTTLFRYCILSQISRTEAKFSLPKGDPVVPCYVPLKALDTADEHPILSHILKSNPYFRGSRGLKRLTNLARKQKLMLFLDGYDEVPVVGGLDNIREEIGALLSNHTPRPGLESELTPYDRFYNSFVGCRIWLSSRREFLLANPIELPDNISLFSSRGVRNERARLIRYLFRKYEQSSPEFYLEQLDAERFLQQLSIAADGSLDEISNNPLFLTMMCFVYVGDLRDGREPTQIWRQGSYKLINRCIELLLEDIDKYKVRGLTKVQREALRGRRSAFVAEKKEFLGYLCAECYFNRESVVGADRITELAIEFFSTQSGTQNVEDIRNGLNSNDPTANLVTQLIYSGVLVGVEYDSSGMLYDFPHRRFREVLACEHLDNAGGLQRLTCAVSDPHISELAIVYVEMTGNADALIGPLIENIGSGEHCFRSGLLLCEFLSRMDREEQIERALIQLLTELQTCSRDRKLPTKLLDYLPKSFEVISRLESVYKDAQQRRDDSLMNVVALPLQVARPQLLGDLLKKTIDCSHRRDEFLRRVVITIAEHCPDLIRYAAPRVWPESSLDAIDERGVSVLRECMYANSERGGMETIGGILAERFGFSNSQEFSDELKRCFEKTQVPKASKMASEEPASVAFEWMVDMPGIRSDLNERVVARRWRNIDRGD